MPQRASARAARQAKGHCCGQATVGRYRPPALDADCAPAGQEDASREAWLQALFGGHLPAPAELLGADPDELRDAGLSWRKVSTLRDLAGRFSDGRLDPGTMCRLSDDELMTELTAVPGIGPWTVQGAMIIALDREDVVLPGDLALRKAIETAYELGHLPTEQEVLAIAGKWRPYRSLATSYLFSAAFEG